MEYTDTYLDRIREAGYDEGLQALCRIRPGAYHKLRVLTHGRFILRR